MTLTPDLIWIGTVVTAYLAVTATLWVRFGRTIALAFATVGLTYIIFIVGKYFGKKHYVDKAEEIQEKRQEAYDEIDDRKLTRADIVKRLRDKSY